MGEERHVMSCHVMSNESLAVTSLTQISCYSLLQKLSKGQNPQTKTRKKAHKQSS